jgi:hypothetical protein
MVTKDEALSYKSAQEIQIIGFHRSSCMDVEKADKEIALLVLADGKETTQIPHTGIIDTFPITEYVE